MSERVQGSLRLALFDLDHTLLPLDSDHAWGVFTTTLGWTDALEFGRRNDEFFAQYRAGTLDLHDYVRFATDAVRLRGPQQAAQAQARFMQEVIGPSITDAARALLAQHSAAGEQVVIVTATNDFITRPIADALGVAELIAVQLERAPMEGGVPWITGNIVGVPSLREGKVVRMAQWLAERGLGWADVYSTFYSDSVNDLALLEQVDCPVATNPDPVLRALATERGWRILDLFPRG